MERYRCAWRAQDLDDAIYEELHKIDVDEAECITLIPDGSGVVHTEKNGEVYWSAELESDIADLLRASTKKSRPLRLSIGTHGRYFVRFSDNTIAYSRDKAFKLQIKQEPVNMVAFGEDYDSYIILYLSGKVAVSRVLSALIRVLLDHADKKVTPRFVALGRSEQYFIRFTDHSHWGNMSEDAEDVIENCLPCHILEVSFGEGDGILVRYNHRRGAVPDIRESE